HVGIRRNNPDYYKLLVTDYVLGTGPGFTDRLSARLRDREGLAYTVSANISSSATEEPGVFTCFIGTHPKNFARVKKEFLEELNPCKIQAPQNSLFGTLPLRVTPNARSASDLLYVDRYHPGFDYLDEYPKKIAAVTPADVQAVAKTYLDPKRMILVAAGAIDQ